MSSSCLVLVKNRLKHNKVAEVKNRKTGKRKQIQIGAVVLMRETEETDETTDQSCAGEEAV